MVSVEYLNEYFSHVFKYIAIYYLECGSLVARNLITALLMKTQSIPLLEKSHIKHLL